MTGPPWELMGTMALSSGVENSVAGFKSVSEPASKEWVGHVERRCDIWDTRVQTLAWPKFFSDYVMALTRPTLYILHYMHWCQNWVGRLLVG
jgi:hypothetical protein